MAKGQVCFFKELFKHPTTSEVINSPVWHLDAKWILLVLQNYTILYIYTHNT